MEKLGLQLSDRRVGWEVPGSQTLPSVGGDSFMALCVMDLLKRFESLDRQSDSDG